MRSSSRDDVLERLDAVAQARCVLEAQLAREALQLRAQLRQRVVERLPLHALQRTRCELRASAALDRPELARLRRADDAVAAAPQVEVAVGPGGAGVRRRPQARESAAAPRARPRAPSRCSATRSARARRARLSTAGPLPVGAEVRAQARPQVARACRRRAPGRARRGTGRRRAAAARRTRGCACGGCAAAASPRARRDRRRCAHRAPAPSRSAQAGSPPSPRRRGARDDTAARR